MRAWKKREITMNSRRRFLALATLLVAPCQSVNAQQPDPSPATSLPAAVDLAADARMAAAQGIPVLILYSLPGCPYCEAIRRSHLLPMLSEVPPRALLRQIDIDSNQMLKDFQGKALSHEAFASREGVALTPVVAFYGPEGKAAADRLIGAMLPDFYGSYLDDALAKAAAEIRSGSSQNPTRR